MIGLVDYDIYSSTSGRLIIPNIEIMKLATYYRVEENQFCRLLDLNEQDLSFYDKIYFFSESAVCPQIPEPFLRANNVVFGGTAFTNGIYKPFENEIIDFTIPRPAIYKEFLKDKLNDGIKAKVIEHVLDDTYYRHYAGENKLPMPAIIPRKRVILYDTDFFQPGWQEMIETMIERKCSTILRIHPIVCHTLTEYFSARKYNKMSRENEYILDLNIPLQDLNYMFKNYKNLFLADIVNTSKILIPIGGTKVTKIQYAYDLYYKLNLLYAFWSRKIKLKLKYKSPEIGTANPFAELEQIIETWSQNIRFKSQDKTILEKIPKKKECNYLREQYTMLLKYVPQIESLFKITPKQIYTGGDWRV